MMTISPSLYSQAVQQFASTFSLKRAIWKEQTQETGEVTAEAEERFGNDLAECFSLHHALHKPLFQ